VVQSGCWQPALGTEQTLERLMPDRVGIAMLDGNFREFFEPGRIRRAEGGVAVAVRVFGEGRVRMVGQPDDCHAPPDEVDGRIVRRSWMVCQVVPSGFSPQSKRALPEAIKKGFTSAVSPAS